MKLLVEISQGLGNCIQGTPLLRALWLMGHELDLYINSTLADKLLPLWQGWDIMGRVFVKRGEIRLRDYDFGVSAYGRRRLVRMFPPGQCLKVEKRHVRRQSESEANVELARWLGYAGPTPQGFVQAAPGDFGCGPQTVIVHAGCDPANAVKRWPHWREVCSKLKQAGRHVVVVGTSADRSADGWELEHDARFGMTLPELAGALKHAGHYLGNDSGVGHLAAACGIPGLMLYGPSDPVKNAPNSAVMRQLAAPMHLGEERGLETDTPVPIARLEPGHVWPHIEAMLANTSRDPERELPDRVADSVEARWQHYVTSTKAQPRAVEVTETANLPAGFKPRVSVIIPSFNRAENAVRAVQSALAQTEKSLEVLLVDDGSTDDTAARFASPPARVRYIRKPNGGASSARNEGLRRASGDWIALLDSDDEWHPDKLAKQLAALDDKYVAAGCRHIHVNVDGSREVKPEVLPGADLHLFRDLYENLSLKTSCLVFKRHLLEKAGLFHERFPISNDWDFFLRLAKVVNNSGFVCLPDALLTVHRSRDSISKTGRANALEEAFSRICMVNALLHCDDPHAIKRHVQRAGRKHLELSRAYRKQGDKEQAALHAKAAIRAGLRLRGFWRRVQAI